MHILTTLYQDHLIRRHRPAFTPHMPRWALTTHVGSLPLFLPLNTSNRYWPLHTGNTKQDSLTQLSSYHNLTIVKLSWLASVNFNMQFIDVMKNLVNTPFVFKIFCLNILLIQTIFWTHITHIFNTSLLLFERKHKIHIGVRAKRDFR